MNKLELWWKENSNTKISDLENKELLSKKIDVTNCKKIKLTYYLSMNFIIKKSSTKWC